MLGLAKPIADRLAAESAIGALATGGIYDRPVKRTGPNATPQAFEPQPPHQPRVSISVIEGAALPDRRGAAGTVEGLVTIWFRCLDAPAPQASLEAAMLAVYHRLHGTVVAGTGGTGMLEGADLYTPGPDPWTESGLMAYQRFRVAGVVNGSS